MIEKPTQHIAITGTVAARDGGLVRRRAVSVCRVVVVVLQQNLAMDVKGVGGKKSMFAGIDRGYCCGGHVVDSNAEKKSAPSQMNATLAETDPSGTSGADVLPWLALGWALVSEILPLISNDRVRANGILHGIQCALRQLFAGRAGDTDASPRLAEIPL